jgi:hypothetical protein
MRRLAVVLATVSSIVAAASSASAADLRVRYLLEERSLRSVEAASPVVIALFGDPACATVASTTTLALRDVDLLARVGTTTLRGAPKAPKTAELAHTLVNVPAVAPLYARVTGPGVVPVGGDCQVQTVAVPAQNVPVIVDAAGAVLGPYAVAADTGFPVWLRAFDGLTYAVSIEWGELRGVTDILYFEAADCSSPPLLFTDIYPQLLFFPSALRGDTLYHPIAAPSSRTVRAWSQSGETPPDCGGAAFVPPHHCCRPITGPTFTNEFLETGTTDVGHYVPPFRVELR